MRRNHPLWLYALLIFLGGIAVGAMSYRLYASNAVIATTAPPRGPDEWRQRFTADIQTRCQLTPDQMTKLEAVLDESKLLFDEVRSKYRPEMRAIYDSQVSKIKGILSPEQLPGYEAILEEQQKQHQRR